jgi:hypothetical protein
LHQIKERSFVLFAYLSLAGGKTMTKNAAVAGVLIGAILSTQGLAGENACLVRNRLMRARAIDENTIEIFDRQMNRVIVNLQRPCSNLNEPAPTLVYRFWDNLACLDSSVSINVAARGCAPDTCRVAGDPVG